MSDTEYTPSDDLVRNTYIATICDVRDDEDATEDEAEIGAEFDRWLAKVKSDAALATTGGETEWGVQWTGSSTVTDRGCSEKDARACDRTYSEAHAVKRTIGHWVAVDPTSPETREEQS